MYQNQLFVRVVFEAPLKKLNYDENISKKKTLECCLGPSRTRGQFQICPGQIRLEFGQ